MPDTPTFTGAAWTTEPGAIVFLDEPTTGFTDEEIRELFTGTVLTADAFHLAGKHDQRTHGRGASASGYDARVKTATKGGEIRFVTPVHRRKKVEGLGDLRTDGLAAGEIGTSGVTADEALEHVKTYGLGGYKPINGGLRESKGKTLPPEAAGIDAIMSQSKLPVDVVSYRGVKDSTSVFPGTTPGQDLTGLHWTDHGYTSTSYHREHSPQFTGAHPGGTKSVAPTQMRILTPAGTGAFSSHNLDPDELLLDRGLSFRVVRDRGVDKDGVHNIDVEVE